MNKKRQLVKNTGIIFLGKVATQFLSFFLLPIYTNYLNTSDYGTIDLILTYISLFVPIITIQQEMATFRYLIDSRNDKDKIKKIISTSIKSVLSYILIFLLFYFIIIHFIHIRYGYYIIINILVCIFSNLFLQIARGLGKNINYSIASFITGVVTFLANIILICLLNVGAKGMLISMTLANIICIIYLFISLKLYKYINFKKTDNNLKKEMLKYSLPLVPNGISWWLINVSDKTIISIILGASANGIYSISNKFSSIISSLLGIFSLSWSESASVYINDKDRDQFFSDVANMILKLFGCLCMGLISVLPLIFNIVIGKDYIEAYNYIPIFLIGTLCNCVVNVYSGIYIAKKMTKKVASTSFSSAVINIIINLVFIKYIGLYAAAISTALSYFIMMIYRHIDLKKYVNIKYDKKIVFSIILMLIFTMLIYYKNDLITNILSLVVIIIYSILMNKNIIKNILNNKKN